MYKIIVNYGLEGWAFGDKDYPTAESALDDAMKRAFDEFLIVKIIKFKEDTSDDE